MPRRGLTFPPLFVHGQSHPQAERTIAKLPSKVRTIPKFDSCRCLYRRLKKRKRVQADNNIGKSVLLR